LRRFSPFCNEILVVNTAMDVLLART